MVGATGVLSACLQGGGEGYASKQVNPSWRLKIARVFKQNFTGRVTVQPGTTNAQLQSKGLETSRKLTSVGGLPLPNVFTRKKVNPPARVTRIPG